MDVHSVNLRMVDGKLTAFPNHVPTGTVEIFANNNEISILNPHDFLNCFYVADTSKTACVNQEKHGGTVRVQCPVETQSLIGTPLLPCVNACRCSNPQHCDDYNACVQGKSVWKSPDFCIQNNMVVIDVGSTSDFIVKVHTFRLEAVLTGVILLLIYALSFA